MRQGEEDLASHSLDGGAGGEQCFQPFSSASPPSSFLFLSAITAFSSLSPSSAQGRTREPEGRKARETGDEGGERRKSEAIFNFPPLLPLLPFSLFFSSFFRSHAQRLILYSGFLLLLLLLLLLLPLFCHPLLASRTFLLFRRPWLHLRRRGEEAEIKREVFKRPKVRRGKRPSARVPCVVAA